MDSISMILKYCGGSIEKKQLLPVDNEKFNKAIIPSFILNACLDSNPLPKSINELCEKYKPYFIVGNTWFESRPFKTFIDMGGIDDDNPAYPYNLFEYEKGNWYCFKDLTDKEIQELKKWCDLSIKYYDNILKPMLSELIPQINRAPSPKYNLKLTSIPDKQEYTQFLENLTQNGGEVLFEDKINKEYISLVHVSQSCQKNINSDYFL